LAVCHNWRMVEQNNNPVDRLNYGGLSTGSVVDLLALGFSRDADSANAAESMARDILLRFDKLSGLGEAGFQEISDLTGLDRFEVLRALALIEIGRRISQSSRGKLDEISVPDDVYRRLSHLRNERREHFVVVLLDSKGQIQRIAPVHIGTVNMSLVGAREVFREAIRDGASSIIVAHNHPSGDPTPSPEDLEVTAKLVEVGELLDIPVIDHIIIGYERYTSLSQKGLLCKTTGNRL